MEAINTQTPIVQLVTTRSPIHDLKSLADILVPVFQITVEKTILEQSNSRYELQGEYVLPGSRERIPAGKETGGLLKRAMTGHLGSVISSMGRWRMRLEVPQAEVAEMLPLARLLSRSTDPAFHSRSKVVFLSIVAFELKLELVKVPDLQKFRQS